MALFSSLTMRGLRRAYDNRGPRLITALTLWSCLFIAFIAGVLALRPALAAGDFYAGKTLTIIAGFPPGGGVDGEMRTLVQYFAKHIPGNPTIVPKNTPGAGGIVLANYIYRVAPPDGLTLGMPGRSGFLLSKVVPTNGVNYDLSKFSYVGGSGSAVDALWIHQRTGIKSIADLRKSKKEIVIGALSPRSENAIAPRVLAKYEHLPLRVISGYAGFREVLLAIERGEVDGLYSHEGSILNTRPDLVKSGTLKPIAQSLSYYPGVPVLADIVSDEKAKALLDLVITPSRLGLPLLGPPNLPANVLATLRESYARLMKDETYQAEAERRGLPAGRPVTGDDMQRIIAQSLTHVAPDIVKAYLSFAGLKAANEKRGGGSP